MSQKVWTDLDFLTISRILNLPLPIQGGEAATKAYVDAIFENISWKTARVATTTNIDLASPGAAIDGVTLSTGDLVLVKDQTAAAGNGLYVFDTDTSPLVRSSNASTFEELEGAIVSVEEGTSGGGKTFRQTAVNGTIDVADVLWTVFGVVAPPASTTVAGIVVQATQAEVDAGTDPDKYVTPATLVNYANRTRIFTQLIGDNSNTSFTITHNFNTRHVLVEVFYESGDYDTIIVDEHRTSVNAVTIVFSNAPTTDQFRVVIIG